MRGKAVKWLLGVLSVIALLTIVVALAMHFAARSLKEDVIAALGPESEVADLSIRFASIIITDIRVPAPKGWPTKTALRADRITVVPDLRQLLARRVYVNHVTIENAYIAALRPKEGGGLKVLPSMLGEHKKRKAEGTGRTAEIQTVELSDCVIEVFDSTSTGRQKMRVDAVQGTIEDLKVPGLEGQSKIDLKGVIKGKSHQGTITVQGWVDVAKKASEITTRVRNVDLVLFEPYLIQKLKSGIDQGTFNLDLKATVRDNILTAPGTLTLTGLKLKAGDGPFPGFSSLPQRAVLGAITDQEDKITLEFQLAGDLDSPAFSLSEGLGLKTGVVLLKGLGLGFEGLVRALFAIVYGFGSAVGALAV